MGERLDERQAVTQAFLAATGGGVIGLRIGNTLPAGQRYAGADR